MSRILTELKKLGLGGLDHGWVRTIYDSEFLEFGDLPPDYENLVESLDLQSTFKNVMRACDEWLRPDTESEEDKSWAFLTHHIEHEKVLALLAYHIDYGCKNVLTKEYRNNALLASRVYYKLLSIPGYTAYHIYHSQLFVNTLVCLSFPKAMSDNESNHLNTNQLTREVNSVITELSHFVIDLKAIIEHLQLNPNDMNFEDILSNLIDITGGTIVTRLHVDRIELTRLTGVIYEIINSLICNADREPNPSAIKLLFKCLLPKLLASSLDTRNANNIVRASYVTYSGLILSKYGKAALQGYMLLLQHICYSQEGLERQEVRNARVSLVSGLMSLLPRQSYRKTVRWLLKLSTTSRVAHRQIAVEMLANLLSNDPEEPIPVPPPNEAPNASDSGMDIDPPQSDTTNNTSGGETENANSEQGPNEVNQNETGGQGTIATEDESSQDSQVPPDEHDSVMEDIMAGLLRQRPQTVAHADILRALYARANDVSGSLRTRALAILTDCLGNTRPAIVQSIKELNGHSEVSRLMAVGARSVCDERAAVRKAGAALVERLLAAPDYSPQATDLAILVNLCRDASIIVRTSAISALGDLATNRPSDTVFDAFFAGPMHQLSDPESKVQDQVVTLVQHLLIDRLKVFVGPICDDPLPWMFLAGIIRRNMKRHLQKACTRMAKAGNCINHRIVDILSTHLGAMDDDRDLQCLVLLTCVSREVEYSNLGFVMNYYYKLSDNEEERDTRLMPLTLELISSWSMFAQSCERSTLRDHLVRRLMTLKNDGCRITCASLAARLDPANLTWSTELMQLSERRAIETGDIEEGIRAADLSLVAPEPPSPELLYLFLNALSEPPSRWSAALRGACVAGAGRLCVRDRPIAVALAPLLAALLTDDDAPMQARVNALLALTDICIRYTAIVEPLMDSVCGCLSPQSPPELRRATSRALTKLLLGGFLRLRAPLYYKYWALLADEDHDVREPVEYYVTCCLTTDAIYHHFVDTVLHYNKDNTENLSFDARQLIYDVMLQRLSIVQKLNVQCRLARDILKHAADMTDEGDEEISPELNAAMLDTITLLCGPRMKLPKKPQNTGDPADIDELQERVTTNIVSHKMKRTVAEVLVPAVLRLYSRLAPRGGQIATYLVRIATDLLEDYRQEIEELIDSDEEIVERIHDFQQNIGQAPSFGNAHSSLSRNPNPGTVWEPEPNTSIDQWELYLSTSKSPPEPPSSTSRGIPWEERPSTSRGIPWEERPSTSRGIPWEERPSTSRSIPREERPSTSRGIPWEERPSTSRGIPWEERPSTSRGIPWEERPSTSRGIPWEERPSTSRGIPWEEHPSTSTDTARNVQPSTSRGTPWKVQPSTSRGTSWELQPSTSKGAPWEVQPGTSRGKRSSTERQDGSIDCNAVVSDLDLLFISNQSRPYSRSTTSSVSTDSS
ncbi:unnamed protein product [Arctia plantaginis]|uniref:Condensin complex subunit 1 C-terminal domain-containing protein n=1 Tax=Arctia plantaginis TaxID=874455 RepID=A0A8S1ARF6_ARCPL|nr:unnamed protein product [Arctia plantaginis]CAB3247775.1 unnamed protein product [Arctia plantaginis]